MYWPKYLSKESNDYLTFLKENKIFFWDLHKEKGEYFF